MYLLGLRKKGRPLVFLSQQSGERPRLDAGVVEIERHGRSQRRAGRESPRLTSLHVPSERREKPKFPQKLSLPPVFLEF